MNNSPNDHESTPGSGPTSFGNAGLVEVSDLDTTLRTRLDEVLAEESAGADHFASSRPIFVASAIWFAVGAILWVVAIAVWG